MNKQTLTQIIDNIAQGEDVSELLSGAINEATRGVLGLTEEDNSVRIKGDDVFVGNNKVGSFTTEGDQIEFTDTEGNTKNFDNDEEMIGYVTGLNEDVKTSEKRKKDRLAKVHNRPHDTDSKVGDYVKHELSGEHKDSRMENPKDHDHGHDDPSGKTQTKEGSGSGSNPPDKEKDLKNKEHSGGDTEYKDHGHDDPSSTKEIKGGSKSGSNPPDKEKDLKNKEHSGGEPNTKPHGHDAADATKEIK